MIRGEKVYSSHTASQNIGVLSYITYKYISFVDAKNHTRGSECQIIKIMSFMSQNFSNFNRLVVLLRYDNHEDLKVSYITFLEL